MMSELAILIDMKSNWGPTYSPTLLFFSLFTDGGLLFLFRAWRFLFGPHVESEGLELFHENVERLRRVRLERVLALHNRFVHARAALDVVRFHGQELLQRVSGAVGLERPHLHLAEALAAELGLAAQGLLRDERVGAYRA